MQKTMILQQRTSKHTVSKSRQIVTFTMSYAKQIATIFDKQRHENNVATNNVTNNVLLNATAVAAAAHNGRSRITWGGGHTGERSSRSHDNQV